jgi:hypothetical protein
MIPGGPEAVIYADPGTLCCDEIGVQYTKKTDRTLATGWKAITSA